MEGSRVGADMGIDGVKRLSQSTAQFTAPSAQILGGAQFNTSFANNTLTEGCTSKFPPNSSDTPAGCSIPPSCSVQGCIPVACIPQACLAPGVTQADLASFKTFKNVPVSDLISPEQAEYNVLNVYFDGTAVASFFGGTPGAAPLNYLQIYSPDILYASAHVNAPAQIVETGGASVAMSAQDLLNLASQKLLEIAEPALRLSAGRVLVTVDWQNQYSGQGGTAFAIPQQDGFGFFYFTDPGNPEVFVKVLDFGGGGALCFVGGLSDFYYKVTFKTLRTGQTLVFEKQAGQYLGFADNGTLRF
jgi:hypothetical protein